MIGLTITLKVSADSSRSFSSQNTVSSDSNSVENTNDNDDAVTIIPYWIFIQ